MRMEVNFSFVFTITHSKKTKLSGLLIQLQISIEAHISSLESLGGLTFDL